MANSKNITFDQLQNALTRVKNSLDGKANASHGNHVPKTETANNTRFLRNDNTWQTITPVNIGAADRSHNHTSLTGVTKLQFAAGSSDSAVMKITTESANTYLDFEMNDDADADMFRWRFSAYDTNAATPYFNLMTLTAKNSTSARLTVIGDVTASSFTGNATSATKLQTARAIKIGNTSKNFDGTGNVTWTLSEIGAAASSHSHSYLPLSGGTISNSGFNSLSIQRSGSTNGASIGFKNSNGTLGYIGMKDSANGGLMRWSADTNTVYTVLDSGNFNTYAAAKSHGTHVTYATAVPLADGTAAVGTSSKVAREDHVHPIQTTVTGNAGTATKLQTARTLTIGNKGKSFDGSANVTWTLSEIGAAATNHTHNKITSRGKVACETTTTRPSVDGISMTEVYNNGYPTTYGNAITLKGQGDGQIVVGWSGSSGAHAPVYVRSKRDTTDANWSGWAQFYTSANPQPSVSGNAGTATKLQTARTLTIGNTGKTFDGSGNVSWSLSEIGAAAASHGTHVSYATATPLVAGTAAVGTSGKVAREDHVHPAQTSVSGSSGSCTGNAATATKLQTARKLTIGNTGKTFNGTADVAWSLSEIGAASSGHVHTNIKYLDKRAEDTTPANVSEGISLHLKSTGKAGLNDGGDYYASLFLKPWNDISGGPYANIAVTGNQNMWIRTATSDSAWNNWKQIAFTSSSITGNAATATKLQNARNIKIGNTTRSFNGTADVSWTLAEIGAAASSHSHSYLPLGGGTVTGNITFSEVTSTTYPANSSKITWNGSTDGADIYYRVTASDKGQLVLNLRDDADATIGIALNGSVKATFDTNGYYSGTVNKANALATARTLTIGNTGKSFNGSGNVSWSLSEIGAASSGHTHNQIQDGNSTITIAQANDRSGLDGKNNINISSWYGVSISNGCSNTDNYDQVTFSVDARSGQVWTRGTVTAPTFSGSLSGNASSATKLATARKIKIGNTSRNFDGSGNVTWTLGDIGAAASSHGHSNMLTFKSNHAGDWTNATSMEGKVYMGGWHGNITDSSKTKGYISLALNSGAALDIHLDGDYYANENNLVLNTGNYKTYVTPANIGAAKASHGTHVTYGGNGSATTVSRSDHTHSYIPLGGSASITGNLEFSNSGTTVRGVIGTMGDNDYWRIVGGATATNAGYLEIATADDANEPIYVRQYGSGKFGTLTRTATLLDGSGNTSFPGTVTASSFSGNATSATRLQTARSINGTSFNGTGDITTANWGTARTITIGSTGKSVNGSGNVSWTLAEIGAAAASHTHNYAASSHEHNYLSVKGTNTISSTANDTTAKWGEQKNSVHWYTETNKINGQPSQWGYLVNIGQTSEVHQIWMTQSSGNLYHRGGNGSGWSGSWRTILDSDNYSTWAAAKNHTHNYAASNHTHNYAGSSSAGGNANAAVKLATARSINGTNFDGSGNITTANWGTARTITIGGTGKSVNGSGNVSWSLSEIGALPTAGGTVSGNLNVTGAFSIGGKKITINSSAPSSPAVGDIWIKI